MNKYQTTISWSADDKAFIAEVPELPGCAAAAATQQAALKNVDVVIKEWLATAKAQGRTIPAPKGRLVFA